MDNAAKQVADALVHEFKIFKELAESPTCGELKNLVKDYMSMTRTFEVKILT